MASNVKTNAHVNREGVKEKRASKQGTKRKMGERDDFIVKGKRRAKNRQKKGVGTLPGILDGKIKQKTKDGKIGLSTVKSGI